MRHLSDVEYAEYRARVEQQTGLKVREDGVVAEKGDSADAAFYLLGGACVVLLGIALANGVWFLVGN